MDKKEIGAWLIHHTNKLNNIANNYSTTYDTIQQAGKAGLLLSALSASDEHTISIENAKILAQIASISKLEFNPLIDILKKQELIDTSDKEIVILGLTNHAVLQHATEIFELENPSNVQKAALQLSEEVSISPQFDKDIAGKISDEFELSTKEVESLLIDVRNFGFVDFENIDNNKLFFNGNLFRRDTIEKSNKILSSLQTDETRKFTELNGLLDAHGCLSYDDVQRILGNKLFEKLISVGLLDISFISNEKGRIGFITKPSAFQKFGSNSMIDDTFDLAKAFISAITYGMKNSSYNRGRITQVNALLRKLINGETVGAADAIGKDYRLLELKGVVRVIPTKNRGGYDSFSMKLLKKEIGELALAILTTGSASEYSLNLPTIQGNMNTFEAPEQNRVIARKKQVQDNPKATNDILLSLRTGEI